MHLEHHRPGAGAHLHLEEIDMSPVVCIFFRPVANADDDPCRPFGYRQHRDDISGPVAC